MPTDYATTGRAAQKTRTRSALVAAVREVLAAGEPVTVERVAAVAGISRTTAYRYFDGPEALVAAAHPEVDRTSLLGPDAPTEVAARLDRVLDEHFRIVGEWEPQLRASLAASLRPGADRPVLRGGRAIGWLQEALDPLARTRTSAEVRELAVRIRAVAGIEPLVWLVDVAGLSRRRAYALMRGNAHAVLSAALRDWGIGGGR